MEDIDIIKQLLNGNHLEPKELYRGYDLVRRLYNEVNRRCSK